MQQPKLHCAERVGADLKTARERLGWSLPDTSVYLRIKLDYLQALEAGRVGDLPGGAYAVGFVRSYARALGMDAEATVERLYAEIGPSVPRVELNFPAPLPQRGVPAGAVVLLGLGLAVMSYAGWYRLSDGRDVSVPVQQVPARLAPLALPPVPAPTNKLAAGAPAVVVASLPPRASSPSAAEASVPEPGSLLPIDPAPIAVAPGAATPADQIVLEAVADAWVQVKDGTGRIVLSKLMHAGDRWVVPPRPAGSAPMTLTTGNAGGTLVTIGGQKLPLLGASGAVRRDVALQAASLTAPPSP